MQLMQRMAAPSRIGPLVCALLLGVSGCGKSLSKAQVDRIRLGMTVTEVEDILGKGKPVDSGEVQKLLLSSMPAEGEAPKAVMDLNELRGNSWGDDKKSVIVIFRADRVVRVFPHGLDK